MRRRDLQTREIEDWSHADTGEDTAPHPRPPVNRRPGAVGASVALLVVVALGVALFAVLSLHGAPRSATKASATGVPTAAPFLPTPSPTMATSPLQTPVRGTGLPAGVQVISFVTTGADEGWGTGGVNMNPVSGMPDSGMVLHYAAGSWTQVGAAVPGIFLSGIDMVSATEGWALGVDDSSQSRLLHISNGGWQQAALPDDPHAAAAVMAMRTPDEGWLAMANLKGAYSGANTSLFHFAGGAWSLVSASLHYITDIAPIADGEAWVIGSNTDGTSSLVHVQGGTAAVVLSSPSNSSFSRLRVFAPNDVWIEGAKHAAANAEIYDVPLAYHFDGTSWAQVNLRVPQGIQHIGIVSSTTTWSYASIQPAPPIQTAYGQIASIYSNAGGQWHALSVPYKDLQSLEVVSTSSTDVWVVGVYMVTTQMSANTSSSVSQYVLLHYANGSWTEYGR